MTETDREGRTAMVIAALDDSWTEGSYFEGSLSGIDVSGKHFLNCEFFNSGFQNCVFSETTIFERCKFTGTFDASNCTDLAAARIDECTYSTEAREFFLSLHGSDKTPVNRDHIVDVMSAILERFWVRERFKTITDNDARRGTVGRSPLGQNAMEELLRTNIVYRHTISGVGKDAGLAIEKEAMPEIRTFLDNRVLGAKLKPIVSRLSEKWCR
jgi:hypothetical protein